jgi:hypothetical protein
LNDQPQPRVGGRTGQTQAKRFVQSLQMHANKLMDLVWAPRAGQVEV